MHVYKETIYNGLFYTQDLHCLLLHIKYFVN